jgi:hypothetical protein
VGNSTPISGVQAIIDTGTTLIVAPEKDVAKIYQGIPGAQNASSTIGSGIFTSELNLVQVDVTKTVPNTISRSSM